MSDGSTRFVAFGGSRIRIESKGPRSRKIVEFLYRDTQDTADSSLLATFRVEDAAGGDSVTVHRDDDVCYTGTSLADAARALQEATSFSLAAGSTRGLLFHAAAVSRRGRILLLPGTSGSGKTTLAAWLLTRGFQYLTDEMSFVADGSMSVEALTRPLNVEPAGRHALPANLDPEDEWASLRSAVATLFQPPLRLTRPEHDTEGPAALAAVVFPRYHPTEGFTLDPLSQAQAGLRLMSCLLNARNLDEHGFPAVAALSRKIPSYALTYRTFDEAAPSLLDLIP